MQNLTVPSKCVAFRNGIEIWMPEGEKLERFQQVLGSLQSHMFINWEGRSMNTADIMGIFSPGDMEDMKRRKNGDWVCKFGIWHGRKEDCACRHVQEETQLTDIHEITDEERLKNIKALDKVRQNLKIKKL